MKHRLRTITIIATVGFGLPLAACAGHGHVRVSGHVDAPRPTLVHIGPGIWVIEDHDRPVFYHDGAYWLYSDGVWLRSRVHTGSFVRVQASVVPRALIRIERPRRYVHYKARAGVHVREAPPPAHSRGDNKVRDHGDRSLHESKSKKRAKSRKNSRDG